LVYATCSFASPCKKPLDDNTLRQLRLGSFYDTQLQPGQTRQFELIIPVGYAPDIKVPACVSWEVKPAGKGATIDQQGLFAVDAKTEPGSKFTVIAHIENGRADRDTTVYVYTPKSQPLVGIWRQEEQYDCGSGERIYAEPIGELEFRAVGWFSVTWQPFETYRDYWGNYSTDVTKQTLSLKTAGGAYVPKDFRGEGSFSLIDDKTLELRGVFLGSRERDPEFALKSDGPHCRYVFKLSSRPE
jgi:hypothetical protein